MSEDNRSNQSIRRREFLRSAACAAGALAAPWIVPASALGREPGKVAPSERIGVAIVGLGTMAGCVAMTKPDDALRGVNLNDATNTWGWGHVPAFGEDPRSQVVALCDVNRERVAIAEALIERLTGQRGVPSCGDYREILRREDVDAVVVATPDHWHATISVEACRHGKDVYCEKPLALSIRDGRAIVDAVERYGRVFQYGSQSCSNPQLWAVCKLVREGALGEINDVSLDLGPAPKRVCDLPAWDAPERIDWEMWLGPAPWRPYHPALAHARWRGYRDFGGGPVLDSGGHAVDVLSCSLGLDRTGPVEVTAPGSDKEGGTQTVRYANGIVLRRLRGRRQHRLPPAVTQKCNFRWPVEHVTGARGEAWFSMLTSKWHVEPEPLRKEFEARVVQEVAQAPSSNHQGNFIEGILARRQPITDAEAAHRSITLSHLLCIAEWTGRTIRWNPDAEQIVGDDEAARLLGVSKREPWRV